MNASELVMEEELIEEYIYRFYDKSKKDSEPIMDGIVDVEKYRKSKLKICWILKEPYCEGDGTGGGWSLTKDILLKKDFNPGKSPTWQPMIYVTYSLLNNFIDYSNMDFIRDDPKMSNSLKSIAFINVNKMPGYTRSNDIDIAKKYQEWRPLLHWQLKIYDPQILIFGHTFKHFQKDLGIKNKEIKNDFYVLKNNKIYIHAYHPAQTQITRDDYVQGIIDVVKNNIGTISQ